MRKLTAAVLAFMLIAASGCGVQGWIGSTSTESSSDSSSQSGVNSSIEWNIKEESEDWESENPIQIPTDGSETAINGVTFSDDAITITKAGTYVFSGTYTKQIIVNVTDTDTVRLVLNNASCNFEGDAVIFVQNADKVLLTLAEGSDNYITDSSQYNETTEASAAVYSKDDLKINGSGKLTIQANYNNAIQSKDDLFVLNGELVITATDKGLVGKDSVKIAGGNITITSGKDAIQSTNAEEDGKGYIYITGGTFTLVSGQDGIQAETELLIAGGTFHITTGGGSETVVRTQSGFERSMFDRAGSSAQDETEGSSKGIKASGNLTIEDGTFVIDSADDSIHSNAGVSILGGTYTCYSGDDAFHADDTLLISAGVIDILTSYEGLEGQNVTISGGTISVVSTDDGINAAGGNDGSGFGGFTGFSQGSSTSSDQSAKIEITGGDITVNALGDGIDSNGSIEMSGGRLIIFGPADNNNGAIDYENSFVISGGELLAVGTNGMFRTVSSNSTIYTIVSSAVSGQQGSTIAIVDENGSELISVNALRSFNTILYSSVDLEEGNTYSIEIDGQSMQSIQVSDTISGTISGGMMNDGRGGMMNGGMGDQNQMPNDRGGFGGGNDSFDPRQNQEFDNPDGGMSFDGEMPNGEMPNGEMPFGDMTQIPDENGQFTQQGKDGFSKDGGKGMSDSGKSFQ